MTLNLESRTGNPLGPREMNGNSPDVNVGLAYAGEIARQRKDHEIGIGHLLTALTISPDAGPLLNDYGFNYGVGLDALKRLRGRNLLKPFGQKMPPHVSGDLKDLLDRSALNNLVFSSGEGQMSSLSLLHAILTSDYSGIKIEPRQVRVWGIKATDISLMNEGRQMLRVAGVDMEKLIQEVSKKVAEQYRPKAPPTVSA